jgi:hypothetical protein
LEKNDTLTWSLPRKKLRTCGALQGGLPLFSVCEAIVICKIAEASKSTRTKAGSRPSRHIQTQASPESFFCPLSPESLNKSLLTPDFPFTDPGFYGVWGKWEHDCILSQPADLGF